MGEAGVRLSEPQKFFLTTAKSTNLFLAGVGSGKTHTLGLRTGVRIQQFPHVFGFIGANTYNQLNTSTMYRARQVWKDLFGWVEGRDYVIGKKPPANFKTDLHNFDGYNGIASFWNGAVIFLGSLDNAKAHDGKEFGWAALDETKDTREADVKETIVTRLRMPGMWFDGRGALVGEEPKGGEAYNPLDIFTSPAKVRWLNEWFGLDKYRPEIESRIYDRNDFFSVEEGHRCVVVSSTYHNEANLPDGYIARVIADNTEERANALIYGNPFTRTGGEFYSSFSAVRHVGRVSFDPELPVHISFDQNVVPYITATLWQVATGQDSIELRQIDEFCLQNPNNTTERLCQAIKAKWGASIRSVFFYGDASGHKRDTRSDGTDYTIVARELRRYLSNNSDRTMRQNPPVILRRDFINNIFDGRTKYRVLIDERCKETVADLTYVKQDPNGHKWKEKVKDDVSGQKYEKYGHTSDSMDYFITRIAGSDFERFCRQI